MNLPGSPILLVNALIRNFGSKNKARHLSKLLNTDEVMTNDVS